MATITDIGQVVAVGVPGTPVGGLLLDGSGWLLGWCLAETSGTTPAVATLHDGGDANGPVLAYVAIPTGATVAIPAAFPGTPFTAGLHLAVAKGNVAGCVTVGRV